MTDGYFNDRNDYENDLKNFLESDFIEEDISEAEGDSDYASKNGIVVSDNNKNETNKEEEEGVIFSDISHEIVGEIDFNLFSGDDFKSSLNGINRTYESNRRRIGKRKKPLDNEMSVKRTATLYGKRNKYGEAKTTKRIIVPSTQKVIIEGVDNFIMGEDKDCNSVKSIGYYKCKKLRELVLTINNNSAIDFDFELFNPSMPLDYLHSTSLNLNNKIQVGGGGNITYTDVLFNILANPTFIPNAKFTFAGPNLQGQLNQPLVFANKKITGDEKINPLQLNLQIDNMQVANDIVFFDIISNLNRPFIPNGMDIIKYKVLAGNTVTFAFYYGQRDLRKMFYKEAKYSKILL